MEGEESVLLARIETKLDLALSRGEDHEDRLRKLERAVYWAAGVAAAGGGVLGTLVTNVAG